MNVSELVIGTANDNSEKKHKHLKSENAENVQYK